MKPPGAMKHRIHLGLSYANKFDHLGKIMPCGLKNTIKHVFYRSNSGFENLVINNNSFNKIKIWE